MPFIPVPDAAKAAIHYQRYGQEAINTLWFVKDGGWDATSLNDLCVALNSWVVTELLPIMSTGTFFTGTSAVDMSAEGEEGVEVTLTPPEEGGNAVAGLPNNVTAAIKFLTGFTGRSNRGRNYIFGLGENQVTGDTLADASVSAIQDAYDSLGSYLVGLAADHVVASLFSGVDVNGDPIPRAEGITKVVTQYAMDNIVDSMRRRLTGRGN